MTAASFSISLTAIQPVCVASRNESPQIRWNAKVYDNCRGTRERRSMGSAISACLCCRRSRDCAYRQCLSTDRAPNRTYKAAD